MAFLVTKFAVSAAVIVLIAEVAKRSTLLGAVLASVPAVSVLAMLRIWLETRDAERLATFSCEIVWLVLPSLALFAVFPVLVRSGVGFWWSLAAGTASTAIAYAAALQVMGWLRG